MKCVMRRSSLYFVFKERRRQEQDSRFIKHKMAKLKSH